MNRSLFTSLVILVFSASSVLAEDAKPKLGETQVKRSGKTFIQVYFDENFKGKSVRVEVPCELNNDARLKDLGISNDSIMSMKIPDGVTVTLYAAAGYGGTSASFMGKAATLGELKGQASSLKAEMK